MVRLYTLALTEMEGKFCITALKERGLSGRATLLVVSGHKVTASWSIGNTSYVCQVKFGVGWFEQFRELQGIRAVPSCSVSGPGEVRVGT